MGKVVRAVMAMKIEIRDGSVHIEGYVNAVGRDSRVLFDRGGKFVEQVKPGTFQRSLAKGNNVELRVNHDYTIGSLGKGNLTLKEDSIGLYAAADTDDANVRAAAEAGTLRGWSFGFYANAESNEPTTREDVQRRFLEDIDLVEVSVLTNKTPAYVGTSIEARADDGKHTEIRSFGDDEVETVDLRQKDNDNAEERALFYSQTAAEIELLKLKKRG